MHFLMTRWILFIVGARKEIVVALDRTQFDADDQSAIALYKVTNHGRATPWVWKAVQESKLKNNWATHKLSAIETRL